MRGTEKKRRGRGTIEARLARKIALCGEQISITRARNIATLD